MKLRKMITVSAATLMLAGVGASATNAGAPVHASSRRTVRISRLEANKGALNHQIRLDKKQVHCLDREIAQLSRKHIRRGKRSRKTIKRHKRAKKQSEKSAKKVNRRAVRKRNKNKKATKRTPIRQLHVEVNNKVYTTDVTPAGKFVPGTQKYVSSMKAYSAKYTKPFINSVNVIRANMAQYKKTHNAKYMNKAQKAYNNYQSIAVYPIKTPKNGSTQK